MGRSGRPASGAGGSPPAPTKTTLLSSSKAHAPTSTSNLSTKSAKRESFARAVCSAFLGSFEPSIVTSKSLSEGSLLNSSLAHAQLLIRDNCAGVNRATSESGSGGRPARFSGATRFGRAFVTTVGATHVVLCVRQQAIEQYAARHFGQLYFAAGVAQTAQGRSGRGMGVALVSAAARAGRCLPLCTAVGVYRRQRGTKRWLRRACGSAGVTGRLSRKQRARIRRRTRSTTAGAETTSVLQDASGLWPSRFLLCAPRI